MPPVTPDHLGKIRDVVRRHGVTGTARRAADYARSEARLRLWHDEHHVWYAMALAGQRPRLALPEGLWLVEGDGSHLYHLPTIPATGYLAARDFLKGGGRLFLVLDRDERAAFAGWVFHGDVPLSVAPHGSLRLPDGAAGLEECYTVAALRGRGIASAAFSLIADQLEAEGDSMLLVAAGAAVAPLRRALSKVGMRPVADVFTRRRLNGARMRLEPKDEVGQRLAAVWAGELTG